MFRSSGDALIGEGGGIAVEFDRATGGLRSIVNVATGQSLIDAVASVPWRLVPQGTPAFVPPHIAAQMRQITPAAFSYDIEGGGGSATLRWQTSDAGIGVTMRAQFADGALELWPSVEVADGAVGPMRLSYPVIERPKALSDDAANDRLMFPAQSGWVIRNPLAWRPMSSFYPDGFDGASVQLMAYYAEGRGGFYIACHDPHSTVKQIKFSRAEIGFDHDAWDLRRGASMQLDYPVVIAPLVVGDWYEAAERYRRWALASAPWCGGGTPNAARREKDGARWLYEDVGLAIWGTPSSIEWADWYRFYANAAGTPLHISPGWDWAKELPPTAGREAWFPARFNPENVKAWAGHRVTPYMNDLFISPRSPDFLTQWEPSLIFPYQTFTWTGFSEPPPRWVDGEATGPTTSTAGVDFFMCPATEKQRELHAWRDLTLVRDYNCDGVCYDISSGNPRVGSRCLRAEHGHPPGRGRQIIQAYDRMNMRSKEAVASETGRYLAQGVETICENVVGSVDFYVSRACAGPLGVLEAWFVGPEDPPGGVRELIPLFQSIYHDVGPVHEDGWLTLAAEEGELFYWVAGRIVLQWGGILSLHYATNPPERIDGHDSAELIHWNGARITFDELPEPDAAKIAFVRELARARTTFGRDYLAYGKMLRPPPIETKLIGLTYCRKTGELRNEGVWQAPEVLHAAWASADGGVALFFLNLHADEAVSVRVDANVASLWSLDLEGRSISLRTSGGETQIGRVSGGRLRFDVTLAPRTVTMVEIRA